jgi:hypothetical protein
MSIPSETEFKDMSALVAERKQYFMEVYGGEINEVGLILLHGGEFPAGSKMKTIQLGWFEVCVGGHLKAVYFPEDETKGLVTDCGSATPLEEMTVDERRKIENNSSGLPIFMQNPSWTRGSNWMGIKWEDGLISYLFHGHMQVKGAGAKK